MAIPQATMREALKRIRATETEARRAAERGDNRACYTALERCQHAAFDAKALFNHTELPDEFDGAIS